MPIDIERARRDTPAVEQNPAFQQCGRGADAGAGAAGAAAITFCSEAATRGLRGGGGGRTPRLDAATPRHRVTPHRSRSRN